MYGVDSDPAVPGSSRISPDQRGELEDTYGEELINRALNVGQFGAAISRPKRLSGESSPLDSSYTGPFLADGSYTTALDMPAV